MTSDPGAPRTILITGCSSGIGYDAAACLRGRGWRVFASCRQSKDCERLGSEGFESPRLDYADEDSIGTALNEVLSRTGGTLDAVFNNGAYAVPGAVEDVPRAAMREIYEANLFGYHDLIRLVLPVMRRHGGGRIINCSSILGFVTLPWRGPYNSTKFALEGLTDTLRVELRGTGIHVSLIEPARFPQESALIPGRNSKSGSIGKNRRMRNITAKSSYRVFTRKTRPKPGLNCRRGR